MAKPDGRVEAGQSLKRAISAQRWNDLCDAADIVHGRRGGVTAGVATISRPYITAPVYITNMTNTAYPHAGVAVEIFVETQTGQAPAPAAQWPDNERNLKNDGLLKGRLSVPRSVASDSVASNAPRQVAVTIEPKAAGQNVVQCAIAGIVFAYVKILHPSHGYAQIRQIRYNGDPAEVGLLESSESGLIHICGTNATDNGGLNNVTAGIIYPLLVKL